VLIFTRDLPECPLDTVHDQELIWDHGYGYSNVEALIRADQVQKGTHITAKVLDYRGKQEFAAELPAKADRVVADSISQCIDHGECFYAVKENEIAEDSILELGNVIKNPYIGRTNDEQIAVADQTGIAIQDIQIAKLVSGV